MSKPQRIQLSRAKGFRLQEASLALNGLPAVKVDRTTKWGNPHGDRESGRSWRSAAVEAFRLENYYRRPSSEFAELTGKNLACWCTLGEPCHADVLLELANPKRKDV
jgi:hypothetical protein